MKVHTCGETAANAWWNMPPPFLPVMLGKAGAGKRKKKKNKTNNNARQNRRLFVAFSEIKERSIGASGSSTRPESHGQHPAKAVVPFVYIHIQLYISSLSPSFFLSVSLFLFLSFSLHTHTHTHNHCSKRQQLIGPLGLPRSIYPAQTACVQ